MQPAKRKGPISGPKIAIDTPREKVAEVLERVSSKFVRRGAARAATDGDHAKLVDQRFSILRTRILREMRSRGWRRLAIVPLTHGAGATWVSVNLALALARQPHTTVKLMDLDLGKPGIARELDVPGCAPVSETLRRRGALSGLFASIDEAPNLSVLAPERPEADAAETLQDAFMLAALETLDDEQPSDITIMDMSALLGQDDALASLPLADAILLVADGRRGTAADVTEAERLLIGMPPVMGVVLNKSDE